MNYGGCRRHFKKFLRHLPGRSQLTKLPLVGQLLVRARHSEFLWSLRMREIAPSLLIGWTISLSPFFGFHTLLVVFCAILFRANVFIPIVLQLISTPMTLPFLWPPVYATGKYFVHFFNNSETLIKTTGAGHGILGTSQFLVHGIALMTVGALLLGFALAGISILLYRLFGPRGKIGEHPTPQGRLPTNDHQE
jgi:uncharacterized protein (DUF2062 family)